MLQESCKGISRVNVLKRKFQTYFKQVLRLSKGSFTSVSSKSKGCLIREVSRCLNSVSKVFHVAWHSS